MAEIVDKNKSDHESYLFPVPSKNMDLAEALDNSIYWENFEDDKKTQETGERVYLPIESVMYLKSNWGLESDDEEADERESLRDDIVTYFRIYDVPLAKKLEVTPIHEMPWAELEDYFSELVTVHDKKDGTEHFSFDEYKQSDAYAALVKERGIQSSMEEDENCTPSSLAP